MITFEAIYETLRKEKLLKELQNLDKAFLEEAATYLKEKHSISEVQREKGQLFPQEAEKTLKQVHSTKQLLRELYERREQKVVNLAVIAARLNDHTIPQNLLLHEQELFEEIVALLVTKRSTTVDAILTGNKPYTKPFTVQPKDIKTDQLPEPSFDAITLKFIEAVPRFIANDLKIYGPFKQEDVASIPKKTAELLLTKKRAITLEQPSEQMTQ